MEVFKFDDFDKNQKKSIVDDLSMVPKQTSKQQKFLKKIYCFRVIEDNEIALPFNYSRITFPDKFKINPVSDDARTFKGRYKDEDQGKAFTEGKLQFQKSNCLTIECRTGFGKTLFSAYLWDHTESVAVVMITLTSLIDSWRNTFTNYFDVSLDEIEVVGEKKKGPCSTPKVYICMAERIEKFEVPKNSKVTMIVDEAHLWCTQKKLHQLLKLKADYFIACSATLTKKDGTDKLMRHFSGDVSVYRPPNISHVFVEYLTRVKFDTPKNSMNEVDYNRLLADVSASEERNKMILEIIKTVVGFKRKIMVLGKLTDHLERLHADFKVLHKDVRAELVFKNVKKFSDCDVLFGTLSKLSTGFDYSAALNGECDGTISVILFVSTIAQETTYEQAKGRGMRGEKPIIIMMKDDNFLLNRHINMNKEYRKETNSKEISINSIDDLKNVFRGESS